jgi:hypothetical protein
LEQFRPVWSRRKKLETLLFSDNASVKESRPKDRLPAEREKPEHAHPRFMADLRTEAVSPQPFEHHHPTTEDDQVEIISDKCPESGRKNVLRRSCKFERSLT